MSNLDRSLEEYIARIDKLDADIEAIRSAAKDQCAEIREDIDHVIAEAVKAGANGKALRVLLRQRRAARKIHVMAEKLSRDEADSLEAMTAALGDLAETPLGQSAMARG